MPVDERAERMQRMRRQVEEHNIYRWAAEMLSGMPLPLSMKTRANPSGTGVGV
jgi:trehalose-6-phosphate synthase